MTEQAMRDRRAKLFPHPRYHSVLSDLNICSGIADYWDAIPKMTAEDAARLIRLIDRYESIIQEIDAAVGNPLTKKVLTEIDEIIRGIISRPESMVVA